MYYSMTFINIFIPLFNRYMKLKLNIDQYIMISKIQFCFFQGEREIETKHVDYQSGQTETETGICKLFLISEDTLPLINFTQKLNI